MKNSKCEKLIDNIDHNLKQLEQSCIFRCGMLTAGKQTTQMSQNPNLIKVPNFNKKYNNEISRRKLTKRGVTVRLPNGGSDFERDGGSDFEKDNEKGDNRRYNRGGNDRGEKASQRIRTWRTWWL